VDSYVISEEHYCSEFAADCLTEEDIEYIRIGIDYHLGG
jgi:hypothetical protein